jgi:L-asparaginase II
VTRVMRAVPGLVAKDGADGVYAGGLPDGGAFAFKILDGGDRPRPALLAAALAVAGVDGAAGEEVAALGLTSVLGHGRPVGAVVPTFGPVVPTSGRAVPASGPAVPITGPVA